jgi:hypothetical protein
MILVNAMYSGRDEELGYINDPEKIFYHEDYVFEEGAYNREVVKFLRHDIALHNVIYPVKCINYQVLHDPVYAKPLMSIIDEVNTVVKKRHKNHCVLFLFGCSTSKDHNKQGFTIYHNDFNHIAEKVANDYFEFFVISDVFKYYSYNFLGIHTDDELGDSHEAQIMRAVHCPAIYISHGYYDSDDYKFMISEKGLEEFAKLHMLVFNDHQDKIDRRKL